MILFFGDPESKVFALETNDELDNFSIEKLNWVLNEIGRASCRERV